MKRILSLALAASASAIDYHGIRPTDPAGRAGLPNPERGLRIECYIAQTNGGHVFTPWEKAAHLRNRLPAGYSPENWQLDVERFAGDGLTVGQFYVYLTDYAHRPLDRLILDRIQAEFDRMRRAGVKALLRFAYETQNGAPTNGPERSVVLGHIEQLRPLIDRNHDVVYVLQAGFIGAWGEWHSATHLRTDEDRAAILRGILDLTPSDRFTQVRIVPYKTRLIPLLTGQPYRPLDAASAYGPTPEARIGFHNDGVLAGPSHGGTFGRGAEGDPSFDRMTEESAWVPVDGELFWSDQGWNGTETKSNVVRGAAAATYLQQHRFTTFSLAHSYSEREGAPHAMDRWRVERVTETDLGQAKLPVSDNWFEDAYGQPVERVWFDYIRDHLGYRLEAQKARWTERVRSGEEWSFELSLINRGFAAPVNRREALLLLIPRSGAPVSLSLGTDVRRWQPYAPGDQAKVPLEHRVVFKQTLPPLAPGVYSVALWLPDPAPTLRGDPRYAIRLANRDTPWWTDPAGRYGANLLGLLTVE